MGHSKIPLPHAEFADLSKVELQNLADGLLNPEPWVVERCVQFVLAETHGLRHGRVRAMICRRLKHCELGRTHRTELVSCITNRLSLGNFSEQFKDQLRLSLHLDFEKTMKVSQGCLTSPMHHVKRYAEWVLSEEHLKSSSNPALKRDAPSARPLASR
jgi:hypothetical protein